VIARETASRLGLKMRADILERRRYTKTQTRLDVSSKTANVSGAFQINEKIQDEIMQICGNHILIIDDVFTTGATLHACFRALREVLPQGVRISVATLGFVGR
jgi:predicted amidophosphoribosyltransferase